mgnify:CR=1 FL=1
MAEFMGLSVSIGADTKKFDKDIKKVDGRIRGTTNIVNSLNKSLELDFDDERFGEALEQAQKTIELTEFKAKSLKDELKYLEDTGKVDTTSYQNLQSQLIRTESDAVLLKNKLEEINNLRLDRISDQVKGVGDSISKAGNVLKPFSVAATGLLASFVAIGKSSISSASDVSDFSQQVNISAEELQKWQYIAMQSGLQNTELQNAFVKTQSALADLSKGDSGKSAEALRMLGISSEEAAKGMGANLDIIISRLASIEDPIQKASLANEIFGDKLGSKIIPLLNQGGTGLATLTSEFEALGYMSNEQVENLSSFDDKLNMIKTSLANIKNQIGAAMLPLMETFASFLSEKVVPAIQNVANWFMNLSDGQQKFLFGALAVVAGLAPFLSIIGKMTSGIGSLISSTGGLTKALSLLSAHPIIGVIGLIVGLLALMYSKNEEFRESINSLVSTIGSALMPVFEIFGNILNTIMGIIGPIIDMLAVMLLPIIDGLGLSIGILGEILKFVLLPLQVLSKILEVIFNLIKPLITIITEFASVIQNVLGGAFDWIMQKFKGITDGIMKYFEIGINWLIDKVNWLIDKLNKVTGVVGISINKIDRIDLTSNKSNQKTVAPEKTKDPVLTPEQAITNTQNWSSPQTITNNDYSKKEVKVDVHFNNYAAEFDEENFYRTINLKMAEQF